MMAIGKKTGGTSTLGLIALIGVQSFCALFFLKDVIEDLMVIGVVVLGNWHLVLEGVATVALVIAIILELQLLLRLMRRQSRVEKALSAASGALGELVDEYFEEWGLTPSEEDVAAFTLKGYAIAEIAEFRGSREGTIKAHLNAIYRKAGVSGRGQLVSILIEDLMRGALVDKNDPAPASPAEA